MFEPRLSDQKGRVYECTHLISLCFTALHILHCDLMVNSLTSVKKEHFVCLNQRHSDAMPSDCNPEIKPQKQNWILDSYNAAH